MKKQPQTINDSKKPANGSIFLGCGLSQRRTTDMVFAECLKEKKKKMGIVKKNKQTNEPYG